MSARSKDSARSGGGSRVWRGLLGVAVLVALVHSVLQQAGNSEALAKPTGKVIGYQLKSPPLWKSSPKGIWLKTLPRKYTRDEVEQCDWRIVPIIVYWAKKYKLKIHDCFDRAHTPKSDHKIGLGVDLVPADGNWNNMARLAHDIGWRSSCAAGAGCPNAIFRFIGYNGYDAQHGSPRYLQSAYKMGWGMAQSRAHIHVSFRHGGVRPLIGAVPTVAVPRQAHSPQAVTDAAPTEEVIPDGPSYPVAVPDAVEFAGAAPSDPLVTTESGPVQVGVDPTAPPVSTTLKRPSEPVDLEELRQAVDVANQNIEAAKTVSSKYALAAPSDKFDYAALAVEATDVNIEANNSEKDPPSGPDPDGAIPSDYAGAAPSDPLIDQSDPGVPYQVPADARDESDKPATERKRKSHWKNGRYVLHGKNRARMVFNYFNEHPELKLAPWQAAAMVGNISVESAGSFNPQVKQFGGGPGRGIVQWTVDARWQVLLNWAKDHGRKPGKLHSQLDFVAHELLGRYNGALRALWQTKSLADATYVVERQYESPQPGSTGTRIARARVALCDHVREQKLATPCRSR